jgi:hypothetical protein
MPPLFFASSFFVSTHENRMRNGLFLFPLTIFIASLALPQSTTTSPLPKKAAPKTTTPKKADAKADSAKAASTRTASTKAASPKTASAKKGKSAKKSGKTVNAGRPRQMTPTPERYRDIQQALVDKGYLKSEPNGIWDTQSADAMRQFQADQKLSPTGKITAASLIGLGLGPKANQPEPTAAAPKPPEASPLPAPPLPTAPVPAPEN